MFKLFIFINLSHYLFIYFEGEFLTYWEKMLLGKLILIDGHKGGVVTKAT